MPSTATSTPGTYSSTRIGPVVIARTRAAAACAASASSARITPRLADNPTGFTTHGYPMSGSASGSVATAKAGCGTSAAASAARIDALSRVAATASGGLCGNPSRSPAIAATSTPWSSTATTASIGARASRATITSAAVVASERGTITARSPMSAASACSCSDPTTTSTPRCAAARTKSGAR